MAEVEQAGGRAVPTWTVAQDWAAAENLVAQAVDTFGSLDILVNNAGILRDKMSFNMSEDDWDSVINVHLKGHFAPSRFAVARWRAEAKAGKEVYGRIINTSSESGYLGLVGQVNYAAAKAGIVGMTAAMARELERMGVTVNAIAPRARTRMTTSSFANYPRRRTACSTIGHPRTSVHWWCGSPAPPPRMSRASCSRSTVAASNCRAGRGPQFTFRSVTDPGRSTICWSALTSFSRRATCPVCRRFRPESAANRARTRATGWS